MTFNCNLDLVGMLVLWVLHIASLRQTFDQSFMKSFKGSGAME